MVKYSIVIPSYNRINKIFYSIESILSQFHNYEIIIIDDFSSDNSFEIISNKYKDEINQGLIKIFRNNSNIGVTGSKNFGFEKANGNWVVFLDSDDTFIMNMFNSFDQYLDNFQNYPVIFFRCIDENNNFIGKKFENDIDLTLRMYLNNFSYGEALTVMNKSILNLIIPYDSDLRGYEGIGCSRIIKKFGNARLSNLICRTYFLRGEDRLSNNLGVKKRINNLLLGHKRLLIEFKSDMNFNSIVKYRIRILYYTILKYF